MSNVLIGMLRKMYPEPTSEKGNDFLYPPWAMTQSHFISVLPDRVSDFDGCITVESFGPVWEGDGSFVWICMEQRLRIQPFVLTLPDV